MDLLRCAWVALHAGETLDNTLLDAITNTLNDAINKLEPVREAVNRGHGLSDPVRIREAAAMAEEPPVGSTTGISHEHSAAVDEAARYRFGAARRAPEASRAGHAGDVRPDGCRGGPGDPGKPSDAQTDLICDYVEARLRIASLAQMLGKHIEEGVDVPCGQEPHPGPGRQIDSITALSLKLADTG
jgi:hypothetical protein